MPEAAIGGNTGNIRNTCACKFCEIITEIGSSQKRIERSGLSFFVERWI